MATLYELTEEYRQLLEMMEDDTVDPEVLQDTLEGVDGEIEAKADNCAKEIYIIMKITFNDATELIIQSASTRPDGSLLIKTISDTEENLKTIFQDGMKTKKMIIKERESTIGTYENYTELEGIMRYTAGILGVVLHKVGKSQLERIDALEVTTDDIVLMMADLIGGQE